MATNENNTKEDGVISGSFVVARNRSGSTINNMEMYLRQELRYTAQGRSSTSNQGGCLPVNVKLTALNQNGDEEDCFSDFKYAVHKKGGSIEKYGADDPAVAGGTNNKYGAAGFRPKFSVRLPPSGSVAREQNWRTSINNLPLIRINHYLDLNLDLAGYGCETAAMSIPVTIVAPMDRNIDSPLIFAFAMRLELEARKLWG